MILKKLTISNFKGITERTIDFSGQTTISGENGSGKTSIMDAYFWLMSGKDSMLTDNPNVIPIGATECMPTVEAVFDMDGKSATVRKVQKYKNKDGKESTSNQYIVNEVPMTERDFKSKLEEYGIDDRFLVLSHPDFLLNDTSKKGREYVRNKILFPMAQKLTDKEIADKQKLKELSEALNNYTLAEIEAMNKATLKRINDEIGKDNVIANARIDELSKGKVDVSEKEVNAEIDKVQKQIAKAQEQAKEKKEEISKLQDEILQLKFDESAFLTAQNAQICEKKSELDKTLADSMKMRNQANNEVERIENYISVNSGQIKRNEERIAYLKNKIKETEAKKFDKKSTVCPTCGQNYPAETAKQIEENFKNEKEAQIASMKVEIKDLEEYSSKRSEELAQNYADRDEQLAKAKDLDKKCADLEKQIEKVSKEAPDFRKTDGFKAFEKQIADREEEIAKLESKSVEDADGELQDKLTELKLELVKAKSNKDIDDRINVIREDIRTAEVNRANAEKVLYQIEQLNKAKNEMLEESVNKHFKIVKWKLFRTLKNGNVEDACIPVIDGYDIGTANKGRQTLAKIDVISGLSKFYKKSFPVFIDNAESLSEVTTDRIKISNQIVMLKVTENKELEVG